MNAAIEQQSGSRRKRRFICLCSFLADLLVFVLAFYAVWIAVRGHRGRADFSTFKYFTTDSNAFAGAVSLLAAAYTLPVLLGKKECVPKPVLILKYVGTCSVALTFFVVLLFLGVIFGHGTMYDGTGFYMHGIIPVLTMISWIALDRGAHLRKRAFLFGLIPAVLYGILYVIQVFMRSVAHGGWLDFYAFNIGGRWQLSMMLVFAGAGVLCFLLLFLHNCCGSAPA